MFVIRREGDFDLVKSVIADIVKFVGNFCFGKIIVDKDRYKKVLYVEGYAVVSKFVFSFNFGFL